MDNLATRVNKLVVSCLFTDEEAKGATSENPPEGAIIVKGITGKFGFHPDRVKANRDEIIACVKEMHDNFFVGKGGGWSFLQLCETRDGVQWGEHKDCEILVALAQAINVGSYIGPEWMWASFPGGLPYVSFDLTKEPASA